MDFLYSLLTEGWKLWLVIGMLFWVAEGMNAGTFALFFGGLGALLTSLACFLSPAIAETANYQLLMFAGSSLLSLVLLRPTFLQWIERKKKPNTIGHIIGKSAKATSILKKNDLQTGFVTFEGTEWRATLSPNSPCNIPAGTTVRIVNVDGITLEVEPQEETKTIIEGA